MQRIHIQWCREFFFEIRCCWAEWYLGFHQYQWLDIVSNYISILAVSCTCRSPLPFWLDILVEDEMIGYASVGDKRRVANKTERPAPLYTRRCYSFRCSNVRRAAHRILDSIVKYSAGDDTKREAVSTYSQRKRASLVIFPRSGVQKPREFFRDAVGW